MNDIHADVVMIGAGIMSATLATMLKVLEPDLKIQIYERLDEVAAESSDAWNNAGTGHSAFCELNYTPERADGSIDVAKAMRIAAQFEHSKEFWAWAVENDWLDDPKRFLTPVPHMSFVRGAKHVAYLRHRHDALTKSPLFRGMQFTTNRDVLQDWIPLVMEGRDEQEPVAATRMDIGTDVNFGSLSRALFDHLQTLPGVTLFTGHEIRDIDRNEDVSSDLHADGLADYSQPRWKLRIKDRHTGKKLRITAGFVFIGAGGGALPLLEKADIPEADGYGGFPVSGQWLICQDEALAARHDAKVYGMADVGAPPMSVPHLDRRLIDGRPALLFGPYAGFSTRFLKHGSLMDLPMSLTWSNIRPMLSVGIHNMPLTKYLIDQVRQSDEDRLQALRKFMPEAKADDWKLAVAGQRVQVIKKHEGGGVLEFGTEIVASADGSIAALLGASPGASTAVSIMVELLARCFGSDRYAAQLQEMMPGLGLPLETDAELLRRTRERTHRILQLPMLPQHTPAS